MILNIYIIIFIYFILGGISFYLIYRKKDKETARRNRNKYISYLIIIHLLFLSIVINPIVFHYLAIIIILVGLGEMIRLFIISGYHSKGFFSLLLLIYFVFSTGFICFSRMDYKLVLFTFLVIAVFDSFSQISGQILGKNKIFPGISPGKTIEGFIGGAIIATGSSYLLKSLIDFQGLNILLLAAGIVVSAFIGDAVTSMYKRKYNVKDFSSLIPGHGGFLDRFDSLIAGATFITLLDFFGI